MKIVKRLKFEDFHIYLSNRIYTYVIETEIRGIKRKLFGEAFHILNGYDLDMKDEQGNKYYVKINKSAIIYVQEKEYIMEFAGCANMVICE